MFDEKKRISMKYFLFCSLDCREGHIIAVHPKAPYGGRRSIIAATRSSVKLIETINTNLILIPLSIEKPHVVYFYAITTV